MRYEPREPRDTVNVSPIHPLREAVVLVVGVSAVLAVIVIIAAFGVDIAIRFIPPDFEAKVFSGLPVGELVELEPEGEDSDRLAAAQDLLDRLVVSWPDCPYSFRLLLLPTEEVNALAIPGGWILLTSGLLDQVASENELAMVLGHELGHFYHRDHLRGLGRALVYGLALAAIFDRAPGPATDLTTLGGKIAGRGFDREQESQADLFGIKMVQKLYGHVAESWIFFDRLTEGSPASTLPIGVYLETHPRAHDRSVELRQYAREQGWREQGDVIPWHSSRKGTVESGMEATETGHDQD